MADNGHAPSLSQTSDEDNSSDHSPGSFATLSGGGNGNGNGSIIGGGARGYPSLSNHNNNKPPPPSDIGGGGYRILPREPNDQPQQILITPSKRPRGRPPGSKNKPKPPIIIKQESDLALKPVVIEIPAGNDVVEALIAFARRRRVGISVLSGSGSVSDVTLRHPVSRAPVFPIHGPFHMLSLTGTYISGRFPSLMSSSSSNPAACSSFGISLAGSQGQVFGGIVGGKVLAASLVVVVATVFKKPEFHRVPFINGNVEEGDEEDDDDDDVDDDAYAGVINADHSAVVLPTGISNNNNNNNCAITMAPPNMSAFGVANSTPLNGQLPVADVNVNVMQWNHHPTHHPDHNY